MLALVSVLPLVGRRTHPAAAIVVGSSLWWVPTDAFLFVGYFCAVLLSFSLGRWCTSRARSALACAWAITSGTAGMLAIEHEKSRLVPLLFDVELRNLFEQLRTPGLDTLVNILGFWLIVLVPFAVGRLLLSQEQKAERRIEAEREAARLSAVDEERARIVRELHDVVGHEVTLMAIQSEAAVQALERAPDRANAPIAAVRDTAHRASRELRAILDLLGDGDLPVTPDGRGLAELVDRAAQLGIPNQLNVTGAPWIDAPRHWLAINRIVQESLTNAGKHARGEQVTIALDWSDLGVLVRIANASHGPDLASSGHGLPGMTERARLLGGSLTAGHDDGRFEVVAWLPAVEEAQR